MPTRLSYAIKYVADMERAVQFHTQTLGLTLKFQSPEWSEFATGDTTLALHAASPAHPPGSVELGFAVEDLKALYAARKNNGLEFTVMPHPLHGMLLATVRDGEGASYSLSGPL